MQTNQKVYTVPLLGKTIVRGARPNLTALGSHENGSFQKKTAAFRDPDTEGGFIFICDALIEYPHPHRGYGFSFETLNITFADQIFSASTPGYPTNTGYSLPFSAISYGTESGISDFLVLPDDSFVDFFGASNVNELLSNPPEPPYFVREALKWTCFAHIQKTWGTP